MSCVDVNECTDCSAKCGRNTRCLNTVASSLEVIMIVNVFLDKNVTVSHVGRRMHVPIVVIIVIRMHIALTKRTKKV